MLRRWIFVLVVCLSVLRPGPSRACVGSGCMQIWSTADGGGALTIQWDFTKKVQTYLSFPTVCPEGTALCLYSAIDPGFMAPPADSDPTDSYHVIKDGTAVNVVIVDADAGVSMHVNGQKLYQPGDTARPNCATTP